MTNMVTVATEVFEQPIGVSQFDYIEETVLNEYESTDISFRARLGSFATSASEHIGQAFVSLGTPTKELVGKAANNKYVRAAAAGAGVVAIAVPATAIANTRTTRVASNPLANLIYDPPVNKLDATFEKAFTAYQSDREQVIAEPFVGDTLIKIPLFNSCPATAEYDPSAMAVKKPGGKLAVKMILMGSKWCDLVGTATSTVQAEYKRPRSKKYVPVGYPTTVKIDGLRKQLNYWGYNGKYNTASVPVNGVNTKLICTGKKARGTVMRIHTEQRFVADPTQTIQHNFDQNRDGLGAGAGRSDNMRSKSKQFNGDSVIICK